jgi:hypothetical protein
MVPGSQCSSAARWHAAISLTLLALLPATIARGAEFERLEVTEDSGIYRIEASIVVTAPSEAVVGALLDFDGQKAIKPPFKEVKVVGTVPDGGTLVQIVTEICIGPFCASVKQTEIVRFVPPNLISATALPDGGDVKSGYTAAEVSANDGRTRIRIDCTVQPSRRRPFFVPKGLLLNALRRQVRQSATGIEALALKIASRKEPSRATSGAPDSPATEGDGGRPAGPARDAPVGSCP